jgi:hypothetical protein
MIAHLSPLTTYHSSLMTHHSPPTTYHSSLMTHQTFTHHLIFNPITAVPDQEAKKSDETITNMLRDIQSMVRFA